MTLPLFNFDRGIPQDPRSWGWLFQEANKWLLRGRDRVYARDQRFLNVITTANSSSVQSVNPLTASDEGSTAEIQIAAHTLILGEHSISYNAGTISGLSYSTKYWVYADDPELDGGAVTYLATTNAQIVTSSDARYRVGSITTPAALDPPTGGGYGGGGGNGGFPLP